MSINPGVSQEVEHDPAVREAIDNVTPRIKSVTMNPLSPVEYGRTVVGGVQDRATASTNIATT